MANYKHFFIRGKAETEKFKTPRSGSGNPLIPQRTRLSHSRKLLRQFNQIWRAKEAIEEVRTAESIPSSNGTYIQFTSALNYDLVTKSLENIASGIRLLNIQEEVIDNQKQIKALVFVPHGKEKYFVNKIEKYKTENFRNTENPKNAKLVNSIEDVSAALLEGLWTDNRDLIPLETAKWCEVWLNIMDDNVENQINAFFETLSEIEITFKRNYILFPERAVVLIKANKAELIELMLRSHLLAEFRAGQETAGFWMNETSIEQEKWVENLINRLAIDEETPLKVCILDSGVNNGHQLLRPILSNSDTLTVNTTWLTNDHHPTNGGHGTLMAGLVGYGKFEPALTSSNSVSITHKLCSVKILPPPNQTETPIELWGNMTSQGISIAEIQNPDNILLFCMAITSKYDTNKGRPSSWSGEVDNLAFNEGENQRLIIISAGNIDIDDVGNYPNSNYISSIQNPAQSWNALTVGAYTEKIFVNDTRFNSYTPIANKDELSPYSTTSYLWEGKWPVKPDVVFEGGNLLLAPDGTVTGHNDLDLLSTSKSFNRQPFDIINATSAATALASWFAAKVAYLYPEAWAETIRALIIHSASWKPAMLKQLNVRNNNRSDYKSLMKVFGYGVPDIEKALYSSESAFTYIAQETIQPFSFKRNDERVTSDTETKDIHFYNLPWPKDLLLSLGRIPVKLKITLSYFVEPGPGSIGWKDKYRYQSFGLRFDINNLDESLEDFKKRINAEAREVDEIVRGNSGSSRWALGSNNRSNGSIHSDYWEGTAAELATCNLIGIYPVVGWWRERKHLGKVEDETRYSLIVSLETEAQDVNIYTAVQTMIETPIEISTR